MTTNDELIARLPKERQARIFAMVEREIAKWGGVREGAGRKAKEPGKVLSFTKRLTEKEVQFIDYARSHHLNYDDLMQG